MIKSASHGPSMNPRLKILIAESEIYVRTASPTVELEVAAPHQALITIGIMPTD